MVNKLISNRIIINDVYFEKKFSFIFRFDEKVISKEIEIVRLFALFDQSWAPLAKKAPPMQTRFFSIEMNSN